MALLVDAVNVPLFVTAVSELDEQALGAAVQRLSVEEMDDVLALFLALHPREAYTSALHVRVAENAGRDDAAMLRQHVLQVRLGHVRRQVGYVQVCGIRLDLAVQALRGRHLHHVTRRHRPEHDQSTHQPDHGKRHSSSGPAERANRSVN